ncbi:MAG: 3-dehydroquinate synthase [Marinifilaceae bacterium]|jgi:3-dehydroquinate synthase|nr:3-dehydroquinate synthase [Marinifilaceae bacterium]
METLSFPIISKDINQSLKDYLSKNHFDLIVLLYDKNTYQHCKQKLDESYSVYNFKEIIVESEEDNKSIEQVINIWNKLDVFNASRASLLINVGGGMITDMGGFAASCYKRGISFINIPTSLLAQVDASVGGKTGINFNGFKNNIGVFNNAKRVFINTDFLRTLDKKQILSGYGEMLKHGILSDENYLNDLINFNLSTLNFQELNLLINQSIHIKYKFVEEDPNELNIRKALNFGHTIGHAIESYAIKNNQDILHGEAVAIGIIAELYLSHKYTNFPIEIYTKIRSYIRNIYPRFTLPNNTDELLMYMKHDKKNTNDKINFTLMRNIGDYTIDNYCTKEDILNSLKQI